MRFPGILKMNELNRVGPDPQDPPLEMGLAIVWQLSSQEQIENQVFVLRLLSRFL